MKPLYIEGARGTRVKADGPSLLVEREGEAARRYPLQRLSRVTICGHAMVDYAALRLCVDQGIAVTALAASGEPAGFFLPWKPAAERPGELLEEFLGRSDWRGRWEDWRRAEERREVMKTLRANGLQVYAAQTAAAQAALRRLAARQQGAERILRAWRGLLGGEVHAALVEAGFGAESLCERRAGIRLGEALTEILSWRHWSDLLQGRNREMGWRQAVAGYEEIREREGRRARGLADRFGYWLGGQRWR